MDSEAYDLSKFNSNLSKIGLEVVKLFNKIKQHLHKSNSSNYDYISTHLFNCIKLFNDNKIDSFELKNSIKSLLDCQYPHLYYDFIQIMNKIQKDVNNSENEKKDFHRISCNEIEIRKDLRFSFNDGGPSYRLLPSDYNHKKCSGRKNLKICHDCLNNEYICFPSMISEDTSAVSSKKNIHEEQITKLEDERYEVDMFQEINKYALKHLCEVNKKMESMSKEEKMKFQLDDNIGGSSAILMRKAIYRIYGDATDNMIEGLKVRPKMAIPLVISRMQEKTKEWNQIHSKFKMVWEDRANKHYWQSLDYQGDWTKRDSIFLKRSTFFSQIDSLSKGFSSINQDFLKSDFIRILSRNKISSIYEHSIHTQNSPRGIYGNLSETPLTNGTEVGPHLTLLLPTDSELFVANVGISIEDIINDTNSLITNHITMLSNLSKEDRQLLIDYISQVLGYFFGTPGIEISEFPSGSVKEQKKSDRAAMTATDRKLKCKRTHTNNEEQVYEKSSKVPKRFSSKKFTFNEDLQSRHVKYNLMIGNSYMYTLLRLVHVLIDRLSALKIHSIKMSQEDSDFENSCYNENSSSEEIDRYNKVLNLLIDSNELNSDASLSIDNKIRNLYHTKAFLWFTIPRLIQQIAKTSQQIICNGLESSKDLVDLYCIHSKFQPSGTRGSMANRELYLPKAIKYTNEAVDFCINQGMICFLFVFIRQEGRLLIQMIDPDNIKRATVFSNGGSECESTISDNLKPITDDTTDCLSCYGKPPTEIASSAQISNSNKNRNNNPMFLRKNLRKCVRQLNERLIDYWRNKSLDQSFPSMEEIILMKSSDDEAAGNNEGLIDYLRDPIKEYYRNAFDGAGEVFEFLFDRSERSNKNGYLIKKSIFCRNLNSERISRRISLEEVISRIQ